MLTPVFAEKLVSKLVRERKPAMVYLGDKLWLAYAMWAVAWCASWFVGVRWWDMVMAGPFGLKDLKRMVKENEGKKGK
jgi:1-acylglycerone phosphate reductase